MSLLHIGVALGLSAAAAFLVTGAAMRPIEQGAVFGCADAGRSACEPAGSMRLAGGATDGSSLRLDTDQRNHGRRFPNRMRAPDPDCHRDVRKHYVPGYGVILHSHAGRDCTIRRAYRSGSG